MAKIAGIIWVWLAAAGAVWAAEPAAARIEAALERLAGQPGMTTAMAGFCVVALADGRTVAAFHPDVALVPASTVKAVTTAAALEILGPDERFSTKLWMTGEAGADGVLAGDVVVEGGGDPTLGSDDGVRRLMAAWVEAVRKAGVRRIEGRVIGDERVMDTRGVPNDWYWSDLGNYYGAGAYGLNIGGNEYRLTFRPGRTGTPAEFAAASPEPPGVRFFNEMRTGAPDSGDHGYAFAGPYATVIYLRGTVPGGRKSYAIRGSLPDPALACAVWLKEALTAAGIPVGGEATTSRLLEAAGQQMPPLRNQLAETKSDSLAAMIRETNLWSRNLQAEALLKTIGRRAGSGGSTEAGAEAVLAHWRQRGVQLVGCTLADGCGLSRSNLFTARQMAQIMAAAGRGPQADAFLQTLPVAGRTGTMRNIGDNTAAEGRIAAKTGTMNRIKCLAGFITGASGTRYAFAFMVNGYSGSHAAAVAKMERVLATAVGAL